MSLYRICYDLRLNNCLSDVTHAGYANSSCLTWHQIYSKNERGNWKQQNYNYRNEHKITYCSRQKRDRKTIKRNKQRNLQETYECDEFQKPIDENINLSYNLCNIRNPKPYWQNKICANRIQYTIVQYFEHYIMKIYYPSSDKITV